MGFLRNTVFILTGMKHFGKSGYEQASKSFDNRCGVYCNVLQHRLQCHLPCLPRSVMQRDLKGKFCMVTGCNQGIGYQAAQVRRC